MRSHFLTALRRDHMATPPATTLRMPTMNPSPMVLPTSAPMDVDATQSRRQVGAQASDVCRQCKRPGHWASNCPMCYDVRHMMLKEIEGCIALAQDGIPIGQQEAPEIQAEEQEVVTQEELGFGTASG